MTDVFSPKQKSALGLVKSGGLRRINLLEGSVRSGKTWISMIMWGFWVASAPENGAANDTVNPFTANFDAG